MSSAEQNEDLIKYTKLNKIGEGSFGEVYRVKDTETGQMFAAKIMLKEVNSNSQEEMLSISREVNINASFDHPTVLKFIKYSSNNFENKPKPVIITEYAANGSLSSFVNLC